MSTKEEKLAREIAIALDDLVALPIYEKFTAKFQKDFCERFYRKPSQFLR